MYSIGELSRLTGVKVPTIRFYETRGLITPDERTDGGQRRFSKAGRDRLAFIRHGRDLGLPLESIAELLALDPAAHASAHEIASAHLADVRARMAQLARLEAELVRIEAACDGRADHDCDILSAFADHDGCAGPH